MKQPKQNVSLSPIEMQRPPEFIKLLANDVRWGLLKALTTSDHQVNELVTLLDQPMNLVSYHLKKMRDDALVTTRRSEADGRDIYYSLDLDRLREMFLEAGNALHPSLGQPSFLRAGARMRLRRILFVCTHNSARSQMAEGLMRHLSGGSLFVRSAGSQPTHIHPEAIRTMDAFGIDIRDQTVHHLSDYAAEPFDYVVTVCDNAREVCPTFPGGGVHLHWGFPDPAAVREETLRAEAFRATASRLKSRIEYFLSGLTAHESETPA